jgi:hypothetical protein
MKFKPIFSIIFLLLLFSGLNASVFISRNATVSFFSEAPLENIEAINRQVSCALNIQTGELVFRVLIRSFAFEKALMQEHFNDNFMQSHDYPNAIFEGLIEHAGNIDFKLDGLHEVMVNGKLTIKDVTREVRVKGTIEIKGNEILAKSKFIIEPEQYNVQIPLRFARNIASEIEVNVDANLRQRP